MRGGVLNDERVSRVQQHQMYPSRDGRGQWRTHQANDTLLTVQWQSPKGKRNRSIRPSGSVRTQLHTVLAWHLLGGRVSPHRTRPGLSAEPFGHAADLKDHPKAGSCGR